MDKQQTIIVIGGVGRGTRKTLYHSNPKIKFYGFDPGPHAIPTGNQLAEKYKNFTFIPKAIWIKNETKQLISQRKFGVGSSIAGKEIRPNAFYAKMDVECVNFSQWIKDNLNPKNYNILSIDIEGAEYEVLPQLIKEKTIYYFKEITHEPHYRKLTDREKFYKKEQQIRKWFKKHEKQIKWSKIDYKNLIIKKEKKPCND